VEALLHALIPFDYVVHLHPAIVNGLTCGQSGEESMHRLFPDAIWIPLVNPGYILAKKVKDVMAAYLESHDAPPAMIFLQNHGVFVGSDTIEGIDASYDQIMETLAKSLVRKPIFGEVKVDAKRVALVQQAMRSHFKASTDFPIVANRRVMNRLADASSFASVSSAYTPDHIVYSGFKPLWVSEEVFGAADPVCGDHCQPAPVRAGLPGAGEGCRNPGYRSVRDQRGGALALLGYREGRGVHREFRGAEIHG
jgi:rhamnose utilization protein RhaD (predicted bifunctional aldolase and dehydrogenase)